LDTFLAVNCQATIISSLRDKSSSWDLSTSSKPHQWSALLIEDEDDDEYEDDDGGRTMMSGLI
jgi:hypothetical protein